MSSSKHRSDPKPHHSQSRHDPDAHQRVFKRVPGPLVAENCLQARLRSGPEPHEEDVGGNDRHHRGHKIRPERDGREAVGEIREAEGDRAQAQQKNDPPAFFPKRLVDAAKFGVAPDPLGEFVPGHVARGQKVEGGSGGRARRDSDEPLLHPEDKSARDCHRGQRGEKKLGGDDDARVGEHANPAQLVEVIL